MDHSSAIVALTALGQDTRLAVFRLLVRSGPRGLAAGEIGETLSVRANTLSANLNRLVAAGLLRRTREGRSIRYFVDLGSVRDVLSYLLEDCCGGHPELCRPLLDDVFDGVAERAS